ncbi:DUF680 domain-containing protein [Mesorhizobium sp. CC13]|uniref:DUF680 domain-containing protein n=1 Tax=Mesorhizobium sp. CC13 TaxID=3029194 RepID=UPI0032671089
MMRRTVLALAAMLAATGMVTAKDARTPRPQAPAACSDNGQKLDCTPTGSIKDRGPHTTDSISAPQTPRMGIDVNPWIVPTFN